MSKLEVDAIEPQSGTTITIGSSGDTVNLVGTLNSNGSPLPGDISSVVAGTGLSGGGTTGAVTINIEAAQPTITSLGTITTFRSTGIDDNADALAMTIGSNENIGIGTTNVTTAKVFIEHSGDADDNGLYVYSNIGQTVPLVRILQDGAGSTAPAVYVRNDDADGIVLHLEKGDSGVTPPAFANSLFIEDDANTGLTIGSPTNGVGSIAFGDSGDNDIGKFQYSHAENAMLFITNTSEQMRITSAGKVGIGTSSPDAVLQVGALGQSGSDRGAVAIKTVANYTTFGQSGIYIEEASGSEGYYMGVDVSGGMFFNNSGAAGTTLYLADDDNVGIGTSSPTQKLDVNGTIKATSFDGAGRVLQVIQTVKTDVFSTTATSMTDITGFSVSITPSSSSNKILVIVNVSMLSNSGANGSLINLLRGSTNLTSSSAGGSADTNNAWNVGGGGGITNNERKYNSPSISFLDSPSSTSSLTYKCQMMVNGGSTTGFFNRWALNTDHAGVSTITVMEIQG